MPRKEPPSFGSSRYWDDRFTADAKPFEWLEAPTALDAHIKEALSTCTEEKPQVLHVGCGTSSMSFHLRSHVKDPRQVHNLDYSEVAIDLGKKRERQVVFADHDASTESDKSVPLMRWDTADLLNHHSLLRICKRHAYSLIVDKSTSDAISCADDIYLSAPYPVAIQSYRAVFTDNINTANPIHPLYIMAINLALAVRAGARWLALSYSNDRFPFFDSSQSAEIDDGIMPDPSKLWRLVCVTEMEQKELKDTNITSSNSATHRPKIYNWLYVLERTEVPLYVRGDHIL